MAKQHNTRPLWKQAAMAAMLYVLLPGLSLVLIELGLRLSDYGENRDLLVDNGRGEWATNPTFGRRFFSAALNRAPPAWALPRHKPDDEYRIFVVGGSAAMGTPEPAFGISPLLQVMLSERHPGVRFRVVNAAMAAMNSHGVRTIVQALAEHQPDLFVVYLGHNEVVGPFGPGTVFDGAASSRWWARSVIALRATRIGQLLEQALDGFGSSPTAPTRWRGMEMFTDHQVAESDSQLVTVYDHFEANLENIVAIAQGVGAQVVLSTVATNDQDSPPFASLHQLGLSTPQRARWQAYLKQGIQAAQSDDTQAALAAWTQALAIDDDHAELHYRLAQANTFSKRSEQAYRHFVRARDLDALRFRADSKINRRIRRVAQRHASDDVFLVDSKKLLRQALKKQADDLDGGMFHDHVHLNFTGNYRLAATLYTRIAEQLPAEIRSRGSMASEAPSITVCAQRLLLTSWDRWHIQQRIVTMTARVPFTAQLDHQQRQAVRRREARRLAREWRRQAQGIIAAYRQALKHRPDSVALRYRFAALLQDTDKHTEAAQQWQHLLRRFPDRISWLNQFAFALSDSGRAAEAVVVQKKLLAQRPQSAALHINLGFALERDGRDSAAMTAYRQAVALDPDDPTPLVNQALLLERTNRRGQAIHLYGRMLDRWPGFVGARIRLAAALARAGDVKQAIARYQEALALEPERAETWNNMGYLLVRMDRLADAAAAYRKSLGQNPGYARARFNLADLYLQTGQAELAIEEYRRALALQPGNQAAQQNLDITLRRLNRSAERTKRRAAE